MKIIELGKITSSHIIRIEPGDDAMKSLEGFSSRPENKGKFISFRAIGGGFTDVKGYFSQSKKKHGISSETKILPKDDMYELASFLAWTTWIDGKPFVHGHSVFGDKNFNAFAFHSVEASLTKNLGLTMEVEATVYEAEVNREHDEDTGLPLVLSLSKTSDSNKTELDKLREENERLKKRNEELEKENTELKNQSSTALQEQIKRLNKALIDANEITQKANATNQQLIAQIQVNP